MAKTSMEIVMSEDLKARLHAAAEQKGIGVQEFAQEALYTYVEDCEDGAMSYVALTEDGLEHFLTEGVTPVVLDTPIYETSRKQLSKLSPEVERRMRSFMQEKVLARGRPQVLAKRLTGQYEDEIRYRVGNYRVVCRIQAHILLIVVVEVAHRREMYR